MAKYNQSFKQHVIEFYLQNGKNRSLTRQHFQLAKTTLSLGQKFSSDQAKRKMGDRYYIPTKVGNIR